MTDDALPDLVDPPEPLPEELMAAVQPPSAR
jgi:hypothetical protein